MDLQHGAHEGAEVLEIFARRLVKHDVAKLGDDQLLHGGEDFKGVAGLEAVHKVVNHLHQVGNPLGSRGARIGGAHQTAHVLVLFRRGGGEARPNLFTQTGEGDGVGEHLLVMFRGKAIGGHASQHRYLA